MTPTETFAKCLVWYIAALLLAPLPYFVFGQRELIPWCMVGLPSLLALIFLVHAGPNPIPFIVAGYLVQIGLAAKAIYGHSQRVRKWCYLIFCCLLVLDVCVAWFGPILALLILRPGE
jgi:hypothetical protein